MLLHTNRSTILYALSKFKRKKKKKKDKSDQAWEKFIYHHENETWHEGELYIFYINYVKILSCNNPIITNDKLNDTVDCEKPIVSFQRVKKLSV